MRKFFLVFLLAGISLIGFTQANTFVSNTATSFTLDQPCLPIPSGTYTIQLQYFDSGNGNWVPPTLDTYITYTNVQVTTNPGSTVVYDFSSASPSANFPTNPELNQSQGTFYVLSGSTIIGRMNWDLDQLNCPALPVTLTSWNATVPIVDGYKQIHFTWSTASESNSCYYSIEWAPITNQVWQAGICRVSAAGNSSWNINYSFDWLYPQAVDYLFRLKMVDIDGTVKYSTIIRRPISNCTSSNCLRSAPNCSVTINGPNQVCFSTSASYTLSALNDRGIAWSTSSSLASVQDGFSCTDNGARLNAGSSPGSVILSAKISGCSNTVTKTIQIGTGFTMNVDKVLGYYSRYTFYVTDQSGTSLYCDWYKNGSYIGSHYSQNATVFQGADCDEYVAKYNGPCGLQEAYATACYEEPAPCDPATFYTVSPIPANNVMTISPNFLPPPCDQAYAAKSSEVYTLQIYDMYGNLKKEKRNVSLKSKYQLNVSDLSDGNYILYFIDSKNNRITRQIKIQRN